MEEERELVDVGSVMVRGAGMYEPSTVQPRAPEAAGCFLGTAYKVSIVLLKQHMGSEAKAPQSLFQPEMKEYSTTDYIF